jgi:hypothetical protein
MFNFGQKQEKALFLCNRIDPLAPGMKVGSEGNRLADNNSIWFARYSGRNTSSSEPMDKEPKSPTCFRGIYAD